MFAQVKSGGTNTETVPKPQQVDLQQKNLEQN